MKYADMNVLITGASSGIGLEFAQQFALRGSNLILIARRKDRLEQISQQLNKKFSTKTTILTADLSLPNAGIAIKKRLEEKNIEIDTLINNAGFGTHNMFIEENIGKINSEIQLNISALVDLSRVFLPELIKSDIGALINIASTAAYQPTPKMAVYGASKSFVLNFTEALAYENKHNKLKIFALCPGPTKTEFFNTLGKNLNSIGRYQTSKQVVDTAFKSLEKKHTPVSTISGTVNKLTALSGKFIPKKLLLEITDKITNT